MEIIAKTKEGYLIQASDREIKEILNAVSGKSPDKLEIGQKIPAIDYATTITKIKSLGNSHEFKSLVTETNRFNASMDLLKKSIEDAGEITI